MKYFRFYSITILIISSILLTFVLFKIATVPRLDYRVLAITDDDSKFDKNGLEKYLSNNLSIYTSIDKPSLDKEIIKFDPKLLLESYELKPFNKLAIKVKARDIGHLVRARNGIFAISDDGYITNRVSYVNEKANLENNTNIEYYKNLSEGEFTGDPLLVTSLIYSNLKMPVTVNEDGIETVLETSSKNLKVRLPENTVSPFTLVNIDKILTYIKNNLSDLSLESVAEIDLRYSRIVLKS